LIIFIAHDTIWAEYGLFRTDTVNWTYTPRKRYYAARQVYKFVLPGWKMVETTAPKPTKFDVYKQWHDPFRNIRVLAFASPEGNDYSILIMNAIESDVDMSINLNDIGTVSLSKTLHHLLLTKQRIALRKKNRQSITIQSGYCFPRIVSRLLPLLNDLIFSSTNFWSASFHRHTGNKRIKF